MDWVKLDKYCLGSSTGYLISATRGDSRWIYLAWTPVAPWWDGYRAWMMGKRPTPPAEAGVKMRYGLGEQTPQKRTCIGSSDELDEAKAFCIDHMRRLRDDISPAA